MRTVVAGLSVALLCIAVGCSACSSIWEPVFNQKVRACRERCVLDHAIGSKGAEQCVKLCAGTP